MKLLAYSKALYSSWIYYSPDRALFDAGESVSSIMGNKSFAVERVFLSHGHTDHIAGLIGLVNIRNNAMGDKAKPLKIYYPKNNFHICELMNYLHRTNGDLSYSLEWVPLEPGDEVTVFGERGTRNARFVRAFSTEHARHEISLGYNVLERRKKLKPEYRDLRQEEIEELARQGKRDQLLHSYHKIVFAYGGDSVPLDPAKVEGAELLVHDATFLKEEDRKEFKHATLEEAVDVGKRADVEKMLAFHVSSRYKDSLEEVERRIHREKDFDFELTIVPPGRIFRSG